MRANVKTHGDRVNLNLPLPLMKDFKGLKLANELLGLAVAIKCKYMDSRMPDVSPTAVQKLLSCGFIKAKLLLAKAKEYPKLFAYNPKTNSLLAINMMRPYYSHAKSCTGEEMQDVHCYALEIKKYTLQELLKKFKQILAQYSVWAKEMKERAKDALLFKSKNNNKKNLSFIRTSPISQRSLEKATGVKNRKAVSRLSKTMVKDGCISIKRKGLRYAGFNAWQKEEMAKRFDPKTMMVLPHDGAVCYKNYNEYTMIESEMKRFRHVIFNHRIRKSSRYEKTQSAEASVDGSSHTSACSAAARECVGVETSNPFVEESARPSLSITEALALFDLHDAEDRKF